MTAYVAVNDVSLESVYDSLMTELRRVARAKRPNPALPSFTQLKVEQRSWIADRERQCTRETPPGSVALWARPLAECFARLAAAREAELQRTLARARLQR